MTHYQYLWSHYQYLQSHYQYLRFPHHDPGFMYKSCGTFAHVLLPNSPTHALIFVVSSLIFWTSGPAGSCILRRIPTQVVIFTSHLPIFSSIFCKVDPGKENSSNENFYFSLPFEKNTDIISETLIHYLYQCIFLWFLNSSLLVSTFCWYIFCNL